MGHFSLLREAESFDRGPVVLVLNSATSLSNSVASSNTDVMRAYLTPSGSQEMIQLQTQEKTGQSDVKSLIQLAILLIR